LENLASYVDNEGKTWVELIIRAHLLERITQIASTAGWLAIADQFVEMWQWDQSLEAGEPVPLLLPSHVTNIPTDTVHWEKTAACINVAESLKRPLEFAASKAQLNDERM